MLTHLLLRHGGTVESCLQEKCLDLAPPHILGEIRRQHGLWVRRVSPFSSCLMLGISLTDFAFSLHVCVSQLWKQWAVCWEESRVTCEWQWGGCQPP